MIPIPAIDLLDGRCVRLTEGVFDTAKTYSLNPAETARQFADEGAQRLHVVDLDAARGSGNNRKALADIRKAFPGTIDTGGGIRSLSDARQLKDIGINCLVLGTVLTEKLPEIKEWAEELGEVFIGGIDARNGEVKIAGWKQGSSLQAVTLAAQLKKTGLTEIIYTDISRDGTLAGPNISASLQIARASELPVTVSGGTGSLKHLQELADHPHQGLTGVIIGKALYEGRFTFTEARRVFEQGERL
ncbi:MAG: 1-(5-phosphoribosyl)-5-((5-phosphoribosylamino)methylideneamino)imidazole-4-carboxamide isomerase [Spirochaetales bacterium]|nr:MAG: 1-(5-phosphoribosyl)-5-((5-phosphoribosylamino)methylideneamino)imidazole-4-carboxamide isomerase [Spirochaetales bacterium]